ncbi:MAG: DNA replication/repair protein RecF [Gammaproteobacteria bacterium]|nr:DNA replication/repair protein RecF [Gammaproteobacteria bacterium]
MAGRDISSALSDLRLEHFRCFATAELAFAGRLNVITGANGAGKTSLLEAIYLLGRGRSYRTADPRHLVQSGAGAALIAGHAVERAGRVPLGIQISAGAFDIHVAGRPGASAADLAERLPVQALHADIGTLVHGGPEARRRLMDWGVFHVEHRYLEEWRRFRRALLQRNTAIRENRADDVLAVWEEQVAAAAETVHAQREHYLERLRPVFHRLAARLLDADVALDYQPGWPVEQDLREVLRQGRESDRRLGYTRTGPQRADLVLRIQDEPSRWRASKGQHKLLGAALVLAECELVAENSQKGVALVVDEPAADLDATRLSALMDVILANPAQVFLAAISARTLPLTGEPAMFHVEHGHAKALL